MLLTIIKNLLKSRKIKILKTLIETFPDEFLVRLIAIPGFPELASAPIQVRTAFLSLVLPVQRPMIIDCVTVVATQFFAIEQRTRIAPVLALEVKEEIRFFLENLFMRDIQAGRVPTSSLLKEEDFVVEISGSRMIEVLYATSQIHADVANWLEEHFDGIRQKIFYIPLWECVPVR